MIVEMPAGTEVNTRAECWTEFLKDNFDIVVPLPPECHARSGHWLICEPSQLRMETIVCALEKLGVKVAQSWSDLDKMDKVVSLPSWLVTNKEAMGIRDVLREDEARTEVCDWYEVEALTDATESKDEVLRRKSASDLRRFAVPCLNLRGYLLLWLFMRRMHLAHLDGVSETLCVAPQDHFGFCAAVGWHHAFLESQLRIRRFHYLQPDGRVRARRIFLHR